MEGRKLVYGPAMAPYYDQIIDMMRRHFTWRMPDPMFSQILAVVAGNKALAVIVFSDYRGNDIEVSIASDSPAWASRGIIRLLFAYPFEQLRTDRITAITPKNEKHVRSILERLGFRLEGTHRKAFPDGRTACTYGILREECKWLKRDNEDGPVQESESAAAA